MSKAAGPGSGRFYTRSELELELGKMALACAKIRAERKVRVRPGDSRAATESFLEACARLLGHTRPSHRSFAVRRLCDLATTADLGLIGLAEWLDEHVPPPATTSDRHPAVALAVMESADGASASQRR